MSKKEEKLVADIAKLEAKLERLKAQLPQDQDVRTELRKKIQEQMQAEEQKRELEAKRAAVMAEFERGIQANEQAAQQAREEAIKALQEGDQRVSDEYARLYAISKKLAGDLKVRRAQYQVARGVRDQFALAVAIQAATTADVQSMQDVDPIQFLADNQHLNEEMAAQQHMWEAVMDQLGQGTDKLSSTVDDTLLREAKEEIKTAKEQRDADLLVKSAKIPTATSSMTGRDLLDALKKENDDE